MENKFVNIEDVVSTYGIILTKSQQEYLLSIEHIISNSIRDDYSLLCNMYNLYKSCKNTNIVESNTISAAMIGDSQKGKKVNFITLLNQMFGLSDKTIYNYLKIADKFIDFLAGENFRLPELKDFSVSKLQELLPLSIETIQQAIKEHAITYKSTRDSIRKYVKSLNAKKATKVIEEVPDDKAETYDPNFVGCYNIELPNDIMDFCKEQMKKKKIDTLSDYIISLIKEQM